MSSVLPMYYTAGCPLCTTGLCGATTSLVRFRPRANAHSLQSGGPSMGPLGFALNLEGALDHCAQAEQALVWATWYLDGGTIIGGPDAISNYLARLSQALKSVNLEVNIKKCQLWGPGAQAELQSTCMGLPKNHPLHHALVALFDPKVGIIVLGFHWLCPCPWLPGSKSGAHRPMPQSNWWGEKSARSLLGRLSRHPLDVSKVPGRRDHLRSKAGGGPTRSSYGIFRLRRDPWLMGTSHHSDFQRWPDL